MTHIASKLEFATLDELEAGFADRLGVDAVFLPRSILGGAQDVLYVGAPVLVDIETSQGEKALSFEGFVAWAYPAAPRTPPGREPGAGIWIERIVDEDSEQRAARMRRRPGAGGRVRVPGTRLPALRLPALPKPVVSPLHPAPATASAPSARAHGPAAETSGPLVAPPLPSTLLPSSLLAPPKTPQAGASDVDRFENTEPLGLRAPPSRAQAHRPPIDASALPPLLGPSGEGGVADVSVDETGEIIVSHPPAPQPRLMAMGLLVDQSFDPTPAPGPSPVPVEQADTLPPQEEREREVPTEARGDDTTSHAVAEAPSAGPPMIDGAPAAAHAPRTISIEGLPDVAAPPGAFEQRQTDVDLLVSLDDADFFPAELEEQRARAWKAPPVPVSAPHIGDGLWSALGPATGQQPSSALLEQTVLSLDDLPSAEADAEIPEVDADDVEALPNVLPAPDLMVSPPRGGLYDVGTVSPTDAAAAAEVRDGARSQGEHTAITSMPALTPDGGWDQRTEHGNPVPTSTAEATSSDVENRALQSALPRPLPEPEPFPESPAATPGIIGAAFLVSHKRGPEVIHAIEPFCWPRSGTKRWNALDQAREDGEDLDIAIAQSPWLARDASAPPQSGSFEAGMTDPGVNVADAVVKALQLADEEGEGDSVFSDAPPPVRPAMRRPGDEGGENEETADGLSPASRLDDSEEVETDRDMKRPPSKASAEATARLGVLQKFLGRR